MQTAYLDAGSFRDPSGQVYKYGGRILRGVREAARGDYEFARDTPVVKRLIDEKALISATELERSLWPEGLHDNAYLLEHPVVPYISYPYEWSFAHLRAAALHHLDLQIRLFEEGIVLSDASAYNMQFEGPSPIFIDFLSLRKYREGEFWAGHRQFCEQFLNPLLLRALLGVPHNAWYRGGLEGIPTAQLARLLPARSRFSWNIFSHVFLQSKLERRAVESPTAALDNVKGVRSLTPTAYRGFLQQLRKWIGKLEIPGKEATVWGGYASCNTYSNDEADAKRDAVKLFAQSLQPNFLIDLGCNTGDYSVAALDGGAKYAVGFDFDQRAVELAYSRSQSNGLPFLPLWLDAANPSPNQGWWQQERTGFSERAKADAVIALAFEHHLVIGRNIPLPQVVSWLIDIAPQGIIEFVPKNDPTVQQMLALRDDIFPDYTEAKFEKEISQRARVRRKTVISGSGRVLFQFDRSQ